MSPVQTTYGERMSQPRPGTIKGSDFNTKTGIVETEAGIGFGLPVSQGSVSDQGIVLGGLLADFLGITVKDVTLLASSSAFLDKYERYRNAGYLIQGEIWVLAGVAVQADDPVHYHQTTGAWAISGGQGPIPGARYRTSAAVGEPVLIELQARG